MKNIYPILFILLPLAFAGCLKEKEYNCVTDNLIIRFEYGSTRNLTEHITTVGVYLFDENEYFVTSAIVGKEQLDEFQGIRMNVDPGMYHVVCWGNTPDMNPHYLGNFFIARSQTPAGEQFYYAPLQKVTRTPNEYEGCSVDVPTTGVTEEAIEFMSAHRSITVYVKGMTDISTDGEQQPPLVEISNIPFEYAYYINTTGETTTYRSDALYDSAGEIARAVFHTPYFEITDNIDITLYKRTDGSVVDSFNLLHFLQSKGIDPEPTDSIELMVEFLNGGIEITFPNWGNDNVGPDF